MIQHKALIKRVHAEFTKKLNKTLFKNNGLCTQEDINKAIVHAKTKIGTFTKEQDRVIEGFYDMYVGMWSRTSDRKGLDKMIFNDILKG
jgi:hypothetical protein